MDDVEEMKAALAELNGLFAADNTPIAYNTTPRSERYIRANVNNFSFQILDQDFEERRYIRIIGNDGVDCLIIQYNKNTGDDDALLSGLSHKTTCSIGTYMSRGEPTKYMIKCALVYAMKHIPEISRIEFKDESFFDCVLANTKRQVPIKLARHNFIIYGKTWYSRIFGAQLLDTMYGIPTKENAMQLANAKLMEPIAMSWDNFAATILKRALQPKYYKAKWLSEYMKYVKESFYGTWREFFFRIFSKADDAAKVPYESAPCTLYNLLNSYIAEMFGIPQLEDVDWYILRKTIEEYPETIVFVDDETPPHKRIVQKRDPSIILQYGGECQALYRVGGRESQRSSRRGYRSVSRRYGGTIGYYISQNPRITRKNRSRN